MLSIKIKKTSNIKNIFLLFRKHIIRIFIFIFIKKNHYIILKNIVILTIFMLYSYFINKNINYVHKKLQNIFIFYYSYKLIFFNLTSFK